MIPGAVEGSVNGGGGGWGSRLGEVLLGVGVLGFALAVCFCFPLHGTFDHDEHQFLASAHMVAHQGLHPYQDFAYFHMPNLVYGYALLCHLPQPFLAMRMLVGLCAGGICLLIYFQARSRLAAREPVLRWVVPAALVLLLVCTVGMRHASGRIWNHLPATFFAVAAVLLHLRALRGARPFQAFLFSGMALGMALGIRLTYAPLIFPFLLALFVFRANRTEDWRPALAGFALGGLLANLPALYFFFTATDSFLFGNLGYPGLNTLYRWETPMVEPMTLGEKMQHLWRTLGTVPVHRVLVVFTFIQFVLVGVEAVWRRAWPGKEVLFLLLVLPFVCLGVLAPTPSWVQYFFALLPFLILFNLEAMAGLRSPGLAKAAGLLAGVAALVVIHLFTPPKCLASVGRWLDPAACHPVRVQHVADAIRLLIEAGGGPKEGAVLTLSPTYAVLAGEKVFPEFVTGSFAWRVSHFLPEGEARRLGFPLRSKIAAFIREKRPRAILTGRFEKECEAPILEAARALGYRPLKGPEGIVVWVPGGSGGG